MSKDNIGWNLVNEAEKREIMAFSEQYKSFINEVRTEREAVKFFRSIAETRGYKDMPETIEAGGKYYIIKNGKAIALINLTSSPLSEFRILAAHMDSPRLDVKPSPLEEDKDSHFVLMKTHYYGGIKKYQWFSRPLSLHGIIVTKDGRKVEVKIGDNMGDPVFSIPDLLPHLSKKEQGDKKLLEGFEGEKMEILVSHIPEKDGKEEPFKKQLLSILKDRYGMEEDDFYSADLEVVPAEGPRDVGFDRALIGAYGQDDKICAYSTTMALLDSKPTGNSIVILFDKEEIGSDGNVGAQSNFLEFVLVTLLERIGAKYTYGNLLELMQRSKVISADVGAVVNPLFKNVHDLNNAGKAGNGILIMKYTGSGGKYSASEAQAELIAEIRKVLDEKRVIYQFGLLGKVDEGGGGTVARYLSSYGFSVIDMGPGLMSMHSPFELVSKIDLWSSYKAYRAILES
ncbi:MAG: aminopeptidase [Candidatus Thermoplasmatota archaeon]|jgi:aspartyl aminopeptidase|nr:aminopeptidase [Candidatus Thermoplasmatota archaeon]